MVTSAVILTGGTYYQSQPRDAAADPQGSRLARSRPCRTHLNARRRAVMAPVAAMADAAAPVAEKTDAAAPVAVMTDAAALVAELEAARTLNGESRSTSVRVRMAHPRVSAWPPRGQVGVRARAWACVVCVCVCVLHVSSVPCASCTSCVRVTECSRGDAILRLEAQVAADAAKEAAQSTASRPSSRLTVGITVPQKGTLKGVPRKGCF